MRRLRIKRAKLDMRKQRTARQQIEFNAVRPATGGGWTGYTRSSDSDLGIVNETTPWERDFTFAKFHVAGVAAEMLFDPRDFRLGSSLDERLSWQTTCEFIAPKIDRPIGDVLADVVATSRGLAFDRR